MYDYSFRCFGNLTSFFNLFLNFNFKSSLEKPVESDRFFDPSSKEEMQSVQKNRLYNFTEFVKILSFLGLTLLTE